MPHIHHEHSRVIAAPPSTIRAALGDLWSGRPGDGFPYETIRPWRQGPRLALGTHFGHGPYHFVIDQDDEHTLSARLQTRGYSGSHRFEVHAEGQGSRIVHTLDAEASLPHWLLWKSLVGAGHDWALATCLARIDGMTGHAVTTDPVPWQLRAFIALRRGISLWLAALVLLPLAYHHLAAPILHVPGLPGHESGIAMLIALFSLLHGSHLLGWRNTGALFVITAVVSWSFEQLGVSAGLVYGVYHYGDALGPKLGHVPFAIPVAWFSMIYLSYVLGTLITQGTLARTPFNPGASSGKRSSAA